VNVVIFFCSNFARASFASVSSLQLINISQELLVRKPVANNCLFGLSFLQNPNSIENLTLYGAFDVSLTVQLFVLGPRLILSVREHNARLVADSDAETSMNSIVFQEPVHVSISSTV
jgi:hypothetical protein